MVCELLNGIRALLLYVGFCKFCVLMYGTWAFVWNVGYCMIFELLCGMSSLIRYLVCCIELGFLYKWALVWYVCCRMLCWMLYEM